MRPDQAPQEASAIDGIPDRLFDGYDGGREAPAEFLQSLLEGAPPAVRARAEQFAQQRQAQQGQQPEQAE